MPELGRSQALGGASASRRGRNGCNALLYRGVGYLTFSILIALAQKGQILLGKKNRAYAWGFELLY